MSYTRIKNWLQFLTDGIWRITEDEISPVRRQIYSCIKIVYLSVNQFLNDRIQIRTSALTYSTLLSIIPILAILFAIARGFGFDALMEIQKIAAFLFPCVGVKKRRCMRDLIIF